MRIDFGKINHIYCLDNGNGNLMAYQVDMKVKPENRVKEPIVNKSGEPAGFCMTPKGEMLLGKQLEGTDYTAFSACRIFPVNFKAIPTEENREIMVRYLTGWKERMAKTCPSMTKNGGNAVWIIGCPNGWRDGKTLAAYRQIFLDAGFANPIIVPESNAAMTHFIKSNASLAARAKDGVMCLDFGAYSVDGTFVRPGKVDSLGSFTGASLIDRMIITANLYHGDSYRSNAARPYHSDELTAAVRQRFERDPVFRSFLLLQGRWLKEQYFEKKQNGTLPTGGRDYRTMILLDDDPAFKGEESFTLFTNTMMMEEIIVTAPLRDVLGEEQFRLLPRETQEEIGNQSWAEALETFLKRLAREFPEFGRRAMGKEQPRAVVMLTGGAAQMDIVPLTVEQVYPNADVQVDLTPVLSIAEGLADFGPEKLQSMAFSQAFEDIVNETIKDENGQAVLDDDGDETLYLAHWLQEAYETFWTDTIVKIAVQERNCLVSAVKAWKNHEVHSGGISKLAAKKFTDEFRTTILPGMEEDGEKANVQLINNLNERFRALLANSGIENTDLFSEGETQLEFTDMVLKEIMPLIQEAVIKTYENIQDIFDHLPNPGRLTLLQPSRQALLNEIADDLDQVLDKMQNSTTNYLVEISGDSDTWEAFIYDALFQIIQELEKKKTTLLGDLIVEESFEEEEEA